MISKFTEDTKIENVIDCDEDNLGLQKD